ncbi:MAG: deoxyribose-phosphate aldolase [Clostridia bacterium]|nr:deoxyribose-phosphate aldolase [Clostridia bacterium]
MDKFSKYFDHTLLKPDATSQDILKLLSEAVSLDTAAVCVNGSHVRSARRFIDAAGADVKVAAVAGFPLGAMATNAKAYEVQLALDDGADEIDLVMNIGQAKAGNWAYVEDEIYTIAEMCHESGAILKLIIETCLLTDEEIVQACESARAAGADFVKTSTGFSSGGATTHAVALMKRTVGEDLQVKASGGIRTLDDAQAMIEAGADRLGCSATAAILEEYAK